MENNLQEGWSECSLGEILTSKKGKKPSSVINEPKTGYVPYILIDEMEGNPIRNYTNDPKVAIIDESEVLLVWDGSIGKCGSGMSGAIGSTLVGLKALGGIQTKFLEYIIKHQNNFIRETSTGTGLQHINKDFFEICKIPLPPFAEQHRIVAKLDALFDKIESNKKRLDKIPVILKRFRQSVLAAAVSGKLTEDWRDEIKLEEWKEKRLGDLIDLIGGFAYKSTTFIKKGTNQVFRIGNIKPYDLYFDYSPVFVDDEIAKETERYEAKEYDILISMTGTKYKRDYGFAGMIKNSDKKVFVNQRVSRIRAKDINPNFLLHWLQTDEFRNHFFSGETGNVNQGNVGMDGIREAMIQLPSAEEQIEISQRVEHLFAFADKLETRYNKAKVMLDKLPQSILAKAFRGELVTQDPNDEPASVLLEKIKVEKEKLKLVKNNRKKQ